MTTRTVTAPSADDAPLLFELESGNKTRAVAFAPNGDLLGGHYDVVRAWQLKDGEETARMAARRINCLSISRDGRWIVVGTKKDVFAWDAKTYEEAFTLEDDNVVGVDFSPDVTWIVTASSSNCTATVWDIATRQRVRTFRHNDQAVPSNTLKTYVRLHSHRMTKVLQSVERVEKLLSRVCAASSQDLIPVSRLHPTFREPDIDIGDSVLSAWAQERFANAEELLTASIPTSNANHHMLASRALIRTRLRDWNAGIIDAEESIKIQPSVIGYIAKSVALVAKGQKDKAYRVCDIALERFHSTHVSFLLLMKAIIVFMVGEHDDAILRVDDLIATIPFNSICHLVQAHMHFLLGKLHMERNNCGEAIKSFESAKGHMREPTSRLSYLVSLISGWKFDALGITVRQRLCEALRAADNKKKAVECLLDMVNLYEKAVYTNSSITKWVSCFIHSCLFSSAPESNSNAQSKTTTQDEASTPFAALGSPTLQSLLKVWAKVVLESVSWKDALVVAADFTVPPFLIYQAICEHLEALGNIMDASECVRQLEDQLAEKTDLYMEWVPDFKHRCLRKLENFGDAAMSAKQHDNAIAIYTTAVSLDPATPQALLIKRSEAYLLSGSWKDALSDANQVIKLDPSSPWGYERKHAALHEAGDYENAISAFRVMLERMSQSTDLEIREHQHQYANPDETKRTIRNAIQDAIRHSPRVLINTLSGRLVDKSEQADVFESLPLFNELISSMTRHIDHSRITHNVAQYYRYAMFSHRWETNEPLFEKVSHTIVYNLDKSPTHDKLKMFCKIVRDAGLHWAWSDTCCINQADHSVLQEALVAMFRWYQGSTVTIIFLRGVRSPSQRRDLVRSDWNTRVWTLQEYHASKVVRFYNEDWTPYLNLDISNHKDSPEIILEMEEATGIPTRTLMDLRPGYNNIREKLRLASTRQTTRDEDEAYSLLGIFSITLPVVYGEGDKSLGRLLAQLLMSSGDASILAWTGRSGQFNTCLPARISVFNHPPTTHIPVAIEDAQMDGISARLRASSNVTLITRLYDRLDKLPVPSFSGQRMKLPCITFKLGRLRTYWIESERVFRAHTVALGRVEIKSKEDLSRLGTLYLVHPWIDFLLDRQPISSVTATSHERNTDSQFSLISHAPGPSDPTSSARRTSAGRLFARLGRPFGARHRNATSPLSPSSVSSTDRQAQALRLITRLRQPFGGLLLTPTRQNVREYRRVAADSEITVQVQEDAPLNVLLENVCLLDVL